MWSQLCMAKLTWKDFHHSFLIGAKSLTSSEQSFWDSYCQTTSGEYCLIEVKDGKLLCPYSCNNMDTEHRDESKLIVDLTTFDEASDQLSRNFRQSSTLGFTSMDAFTVTLFAELSRKFLDASLR